MLKPVKFNDTNIYFVGCTHWRHDRDFLWAKRGFSSVQEHDTVLTKRWNAAVKPNSTVFYLGILCLVMGGRKDFWIYLTL